VATVSPASLSMEDIDSQFSKGGEARQMQCVFRVPGALGIR
jgi:hypothetical protein